MAKTYKATTSKSPSPKTTNAEDSLAIEADSEDEVIAEDSKATETGKIDLDLTSKTDQEAVSTAESRDT